MRKKIILLIAFLCVIALAVWAFRTRGQTYQSTSPAMIFTSSAIGGGLLTVGATASTTVNVAGAQPGMTCIVTASDGTDMFAVGAIPGCTVTSSGVVTVRLMAIISLTPASKAYTGRVMPL